MPRTYEIDNSKEIVISDLCFLKVGKACDINIYVFDEVQIYERNKLT